MVTVHEMDEFFNFDEATNVPALPSGQYPGSTFGFDIGLASADPDNDEDAFQSLQHYTEDLSMMNAFPMMASIPDQQPTHLSMRAPIRDHVNWVSKNATLKSERPCERCCSRHLECTNLRGSPSRDESCLNCHTMSVECSRSSRRRDTFPMPAIPSISRTYTNEARRSGVTKAVTNDARRQKRRVEGSDSPRHSPKLDALEIPQAKIGARFSREAVKVLKNWLSAHHRHPYPTDEEKGHLTQQTGLNKTQITNWLANTRRRGKAKTVAATSSPTTPSSARAMDIPIPPVSHSLLPMERWESSPPENDGASLTAIAKAVKASSISTGHESPFSYINTDDGSGRSVRQASSASSVGEKSSLSSAFSHHSRGSFGSFGKRGRRRRRRQAPKQSLNSLVAVPRQFQCTFCTETFKTKHDWQRHEKSLHLSLERWVCAPSGPTVPHKEHNHLACVFCGLPNPDMTHMETHNYSGCLERSLEERTFYRKDHLRQHLRLVHDTSKFLNWSMDSWKAATPEIRSRCGFCGILMDTWGLRVDHLAEHFKTGKTMADWKGDWGFDPQVTDMVENGIPPYLIHNERVTPNPFEVNRVNPDQPTQAYEILKVGLMNYVDRHVVLGHRPTDAELQLEGCRIVLGTDASIIPPTRDPSHAMWLADLFDVFDDSVRFGRYDSTSSPSDIRRPSDNLDSTLEKQLRSYVNLQLPKGISPTDAALREEACLLIATTESMSSFPCETAANWLQYLVNTSFTWIVRFRSRIGLPLATGLSGLSDQLPTQSNGTSKLEAELASYMNIQRAIGIVPSDSDLQYQARWIVYGSDASWNRTSADNPEWLLRFKQSRGLEATDSSGQTVVSSTWNGKQADTNMSLEFSSAPVTEQTFCHWDFERFMFERQTRISTNPSSQATSPSSSGPSSYAPRCIGSLRYFINDVNCYRRLERALSRFVASCISSHSPNPHLPSDEELRRQARWIIFDDDDPWNQTCADNAEWLLRFKRSHGLAPPTGPGLPAQGDEGGESWDVRYGGTGFSPPYVHARLPVREYEEETVPVMINKSDGTSRTFEIKKETGNSYLRGLKDRYSGMANVFCSRELESELNGYVNRCLAQGHMPNDDELKTCARKVLGMSRTEVDDQDLLHKFKAIRGIVGAGMTAQGLVSPVSGMGAAWGESGFAYEQMSGMGRGRVLGIPVSAPSTAVSLGGTSTGGQPGQGKQQIGTDAGGDAMEGLL